MEDNTLQLLGKRIRELRTKQHLSQEKLSELCKISSRHISEMERGESNPSYQVLKHIAASLHVPLSFLLDFEHQKVHSQMQDELIALIKSQPPEKIKMIYRVVAMLTE